MDFYFIKKTKKLFNGLLIDSFWSLALKIGGALTLFILHILIARFVGEDEYGNYIYVFSLINLIVILVKFGFHQTILKYFPIYFESQDWGHINALRRFVNQKVTLYYLIAIIFSAGFVFFFGEGISRELKNIIYISGILLPFLAIIHIQESICRSMGYIKLPLIPVNLIFPISFAFILVFLNFFTSVKLTAKILMFIHALILVVLCFGFRIFIDSKLERKFTFTPKKQTKNEWWRVSRDMLLVNGFLVLMNKTDTIMVGSMIDTKSSGIYFICTKIGAFISFIQIAINYIIVPKIPILFKNNRIKELQEMIGKATALIFCLEVVVCFFVFIFREQLLLLFGEAFLDGEIILITILFSYLFSAYTGAAIGALSFTGHENYVRNILLVSAILNIILNYALIVFYGLIGAGLATAITTVIQRIILLYYIKKKVHINPLFQFHYIKSLSTGQKSNFVK